MRTALAAMLFLSVMPLLAAAQTMNPETLERAGVSQDMAMPGSDVGQAGNDRPRSAEELKQDAFARTLNDKISKAYWGEHMRKVNAARKAKRLPPLEAGNAPSLPAGAAPQAPSTMIDTPQGQMQIVP